MNSFIETLNHRGDQWLQIVWPLLWQSSLLIALVFGLEFALRRRVRAAIRYALWLVVFLKLMLPPSLAFPTGLSWWVRPSAPPSQTRPLRVVVTYPPPVQPVIQRHDAPAAIQSVGLESVPLTRTGWLLAIWGVIGLSLLAYLSARWRLIAQDILRAVPGASAPGSANLLECLEQARRIAGIRRPVRLRITTKTMSPAVCGLLRPTILLPQLLVERLAPAQLRAVLLHEMIHLRRGDVWVNCAQALLQIVYWWHPLLWLANARIRRVREEAVDDAVMLALNQEADGYAPTLIEVAKLAFHRRFAMLALVGILESRNALRHRIERLVHFTTPRRAGLSIASILGLAAFAAVAVPMGEAPPEPVQAQNEAPQRARTSEMITVDMSADGTCSMGTNRMTSAQLDAFIRGEVRKSGKLTVWLRADRDAPAEAVSRAMKLLHDAGVAQLLVRTDQSESRPSNAEGSGLNRTEPVHAQSEAPQRARSDEMITIDLSADGTCSMGTNRMTSAQLDAFIRGEVRKSGKLTVWLRADRDAPAEAVSRAMKLLHDAGVARLLVRTDQSESRPNDANRSGLNQSTNNAPFTGSADYSTVDPATGIETFSNHVVIQLGDQVLKADRVTVNRELGTVRADGHVEMNTDDGLGRADHADYLHLNLSTNSPDTAVPATVPSPRKAIFEKLDKIRVPSITWKDERLSQVVKDLTERTKELDPDHAGIQFLINPNGGNLSPDAIEAVSINLNPEIKNARLVDLLDAITKVADKPIQYAIEDYAVVFSSKESGPAAMSAFTRKFKVDPRTFLSGLEAAGALSPVGHGSSTASGSYSLAAVTSAVINYFATNGVDLRPPKSVFWNEREGSLIVRASKEDLDVIEAVVSLLNTAPPQVTIKVQFVEVPWNGPARAATGFDWYLGNFLMGRGDGTSLTTNMLNLNAVRSGTNAASDQPTAGTLEAPQLTGILTDPQFRVVLNALSAGKGATIAEAQVTTLSGRQAQVQVLKDNSAVLGTVVTAGNDNSNYTATMTHLPGPTLDVLPTVRPDGYSIQLTLIPAVMEFVGYDRSTNNSVTANSGALTATLPLPHFRQRQAVISAVVWDGQTVVIGNAPFTSHDPPATSGEERKQLLIFVTATIIDPAGNRVHTDEQLPRAANSVPAQDGSGNGDGRAAQRH